jgi:hypothetical protein
MDVPPPASLKNMRIRSTNLWMNYTPSCSSLHYDPHHNLLCVIVGMKTVQLWPPSCTEKLRPFSAFGESPNHSQISDLMASPCLAAATALAQQDGHSFQVVLQPGDALFIPAGWWHLVRSNTQTIAVNFWCDLEPSTVTSVPAHMTLYFRRQAMRQQASELVAASILQLRALSLRCLRRNRQADGTDGTGRPRTRLVVSVALLLTHFQHRKEPVLTEALCLDAVALVLCNDHREMIGLLCGLVRCFEEGVRWWLMKGMSPTSAEVFTTLLDGGWGDLDISDKRLCACGTWLAAPREAWFAYEQGLDDQAASVQTDAEGIGLEALFEHVYSLVDAQHLARSLVERKERLHERAWQHATSCK